MRLNKMDAPSTIHPKLIKINGFTFRVVAYCHLTDQQAYKIAIHFYRNNKLKKKDQKKVFQVYTTFDQDSLELL